MQLDDETLQPRRLHWVSEGRTAVDSSESDSGGAGVATGCDSPDVAMGCRAEGVENVLPLETGLREGAASVVDGAGCGVSSIVECLPVVQGGIVINSSKVRTRGLQHFHPGSCYQPSSVYLRV